MKLSIGEKVGSLLTPFGPSDLFVCWTRKKIFLFEYWWSTITQCILCWVCCCTAFFVIVTQSPTLHSFARSFHVQLFPSSFPFCLFASHVLTGPKCAIWILSKQWILHVFVFKSNKLTTFLARKRIVFSTVTHMIFFSILHCTTLEWGVLGPGSHECMGESQPQSVVLVRERVGEEVLTHRESIFSLFETRNEFVAWNRLGERTVEHIARLSETSTHKRRKNPITIEDEDGKQHESRKSDKTEKKTKLHTWIKDKSERHPNVIGMASSQARRNSSSRTSYQTKIKSIDFRSPSWTRGRAIREQWHWSTRK